MVMAVYVDYTSGKRRVNEEKNQNTQYQSLQPETIIQVTTSRTAPRCSPTGTSPDQTLPNRSGEPGASPPAATAGGLQPSPKRDKHLPRRQRFSHDI